MRYSFFYLQCQVDIDFIENGGTWRWAFAIDGRGPSGVGMRLTGAVATSLQEACAVARAVVQQTLTQGLDRYV